MGFSEERASPIIIRFRSKNARFNFFAQRKQLNNFTAQDIDFSGFDNEDTQRSNRNRNGGPGDNRGGPNGISNRMTLSPVYMQEHLTKANKDLLKLAKTELGNIFKFPGYAMNGEIRARRAELEKFFPIKCVGDITHLKRQFGRPPPPTS